MPLLRQLVVTTGLAVLAAGLVVEGTETAGRGLRAASGLISGSPAAPGTLLLGVAGVGLAASGLWLAGIALVCVHDVVRGVGAVRPPGLWRPAAVRAVLLRAGAPTVGAALAWAAGPAAVALEDQPPPPMSTSVAGPWTGRLSGLALPHRPTSDPAALPGDRLVHPGDSLWSVAADLVGADASLAEVDHAWRAIYRANRARVGPDPDLVVAGTRLETPPRLRPDPLPRPQTPDPTR